MGGGGVARVGGKSPEVGEGGFKSVRTPCFLKESSIQLSRRLKNYIVYA